MTLDARDNRGNQDIRNIVGANVRRARQHARLTQEQLAHATGLPRATLVRIEKGHREPRVSTLLAIAVALETPLARLLGGLPEAASDAPCPACDRH
jgi:transcriptional regulator with XRE-family HTH domain